MFCSITYHFFYILINNKINNIDTISTNNSYNNTNTEGPRFTISLNYNLSCLSWRFRQISKTHQPLPMRANRNDLRRHVRYTRKIRLLYAILFCCVSLTINKSSFLSSPLCLTSPLACRQTSSPPQHG